MAPVSPCGVGSPNTRQSGCAGTGGIDRVGILASMAAHDHPLFTRLYEVIADLGEHSELGAARSEVLSGAHGRLLIVGLGPGHDLDHLPEAVTSVVAVEPSDSMRAASLPRVEAARARGTEVELIDAVGEALPLPDDSVDCVLFAYVLCSVDSVENVLAEARRVLHPEGSVCVLEHVRADAWHVDRAHAAVGVRRRDVATAGRWVPVHPGHAR